VGGVGAPVLKEEEEEEETAATRRWQGRRCFFCSWLLYEFIRFRARFQGAAVVCIDTIFSVAKLIGRLV